MITLKVSTYHPAANGADGLMLSPEHTALAGLWLALIFAPLMAACLLTITERDQIGRVFNWGLAAVLLVLWAPLAVMAPTLTAQLA